MASADGPNRVVLPEIDWDRDLKTGLWLGTGYWVLRHPLALYVGSCGFVFVGGRMTVL